MNPEPLKVYVETSVWSYALAEDRQEWRDLTLQFFDTCRNRRVEPIISPTVIVEIDRAGSPIRERLNQLINGISPRVLPFSAHAMVLAQEFVRHGAVPPSKPDDARHVAYAFVAGLDVLVSWNFRHIASVRRASRFNEIARKQGFLKPMSIVSPPQVIYVDE